ncbi:MAG: GNAT family N-acetyltransferase [Clostridia bacterium]|nr:GNAT family N-acetyltransferase [Clostridia bacterium]
MSFEYLRATTADYEEVVAKADKAFGHSPEENFFRTIQPKLYRTDDTMNEHYLVKEDGDIAGLLCAYTADMDVMGKTLRSCGIGTVCVLAEYRGKGYMKGLMQYTYDRMKEDNVDFAILGGRRQRYEYFGYTLAGTNLCAHFRKQNAEYLYGKGSYFGYEFADVSREDTETLDRMYELYMKKPVKVLRKKHKFYDTLCGGGVRPVVITRNGEFFGYSYLNSDNCGTGEIELLDFLELGHVLNDIMKFYGTSRIDIGFTECFNEEKHSFLTLNAEDFGISSIEHVMILNFKTVLDAFLNVKASVKTLVDGECSFEIEGHPKFKITVKDNKVSVEDFDGIADVKMPYLVAVQKFFSHGGALYNYGEKLPAAAESWFPAPLCFSAPDMV